jgi:mono/diheme cytochrome c family protein
MKRFALLNVALACISFAISAEAADKKIERLYGSKCASCHGKDGKAQTEKGKKMLLRELGSDEFQKLSDDEMKKGIADGVKRELKGVKQEMDGYKDDLKGPEIDALVKYMREFKK